MVATVRFSKADDIIFGKKNEETTLSILNKVFNKKMVFNGEYKVLDWSNTSKNIWAELKSRRISSSDYSTAIVGLNKVNSCTDPNHKYYFFFKYTDGLFYIKYNKTLFDSFDRNMEYKRSDNTDYARNASAIVYIPIQLLKPVANISFDEKKHSDS